MKWAIIFLAMTVSLLILGCAAYLKDLRAQNLQAMINNQELTIKQLTFKIDSLKKQYNYDQDKPFRF